MISANQRSTRLSHELIVAVKVSVRQTLFLTMKFGSFEDVEKLRRDVLADRARPGLGREFVNESLGMGGDANEHVLQIVEWSDRC